MASTALSVATRCNRGDLGFDQAARGQHFKGPGPASGSAAGSGSSLT
jgi:hypothetical protein